MVELEDFRFPYLSAPPNASVAGGGGGGGSKEEGTRQGLRGYTVEVVINSTDDLDFVADHYKNLLSVEGWTLLNQSLSEQSYTSDWDFGFYETRSWLARLIVSAGAAPDQYTIELRAISP
jgi:hypothetical protein